MLHIAICDDQLAVCSELKEYILQCQSELDFTADIEVFTTGNTLLDCIRQKQVFDLIFLDIELGDTTGMQVGTVIRDVLDDHITQIVFITAIQGYERQLFDLQPLNFLKKPIEFVKLERCMALALKLLQLDYKLFEYKKAHETITIRAKDIIYFEKFGRKTKIVTHQGIDFFYESLASLKQRLPVHFLEVHESFLISFHKIRLLKKEVVIMVDGAQIPISRRNIRVIHSALMERMEIKRDFL